MAEPVDDDFNQEQERAKQAEEAEEQVSFKEKIRSLSFSYGVLRGHRRGH